MATARLDVRLNREVKEKAEKASALLGLKSLTEYIINLIEEDAPKVIKQYESMTVENDLFDRFMAVCNNPQPPNQALIEAIAFTKEQGFE